MPRKIKQIASIILRRWNSGPGDGGSPLGPDDGTRVGGARSIYTLTHGCLSETGKESVSEGARGRTRGGGEGGVKRGRGEAGWGGGCFGLVRCVRLQQPIPTPGACPHPHRRAATLTATAKDKTKFTIIW